MAQKVPSVGLDRVRLTSCLGVDLELAHLPHFLRHYLSIGVRASGVHLLLNARDASAPNLAAAEAVLAEFDCAAPRRWIAPYTSDAMWEARRQLQRDVARPDDWIVNADIDEHHRYPAPLAEIVAYCDGKGYNGVQGFLVDRLAPGGALSPVLNEPPLARQFPLEAEVDLALVGRGDHHGIDGTTKLMLHHASVLPSRGGHNPSAEGAAPRYLAGLRLATCRRATDPAFRFAFPFRVDHYKWTATRAATFRQRIGTPGVSAAGREVGGKMTRYLAEHGRIRLEDVAVRPDGAPRARLGWKALSLRLRLGARLRRALKRP